MARAARKGWVRLQGNDYGISAQYGFTWYHMDDCAIGKQLKRYPGILNIVELLYPVIAYSE